jgi:imidazolonepropionase-like amidohydrolase
LFTGGIAHIGNGQVIENSAIGFEKGKLILVADATTIRISSQDYDTIINIQDKHIYPGIIALNTTIGLSEIEAVRSTNDFAETGSLNPSSRSIIAYNTDSKIIPTVRSNGVLIAEVAPQGGVVSGQSSVVKLDGWNYEDAAYKTDVGIHLNWPSMRVLKKSKAEQEEKQIEQSKKELNKIVMLFADARAYALNSSIQNKNIHLESMKGLFNGSKKLFVHCNYVKEIIASVNFCKEYGIKMVLVGGKDAWMVAGLLKENNIPVIIEQTHRLPSNEDEAVDLPYQLPFLLKSAGIEIAICNTGFWQVRNLTFQAGTAAEYGLTKEEALTAITLTPARILGIDSTLGSLEPGKDATFVISDGDLLDMRSSTVQAAFIDGRRLDLDNIQTQLYRKFSARYKK